MVTAADWKDGDAQTRLRTLTLGLRVSHVIYALAELGVAALLSAGARPLGEIARSVDCEAETLYRLLRAAASVGIFAECESGHFALTPMAQLLRPDVPGSQLALILNDGRNIFPAYRGLLDATRTGNEAFAAVFGAQFYDYLDANPEASDIAYQAADADWLPEQAYLGRIDLSGCKVIVDIGGGTGAFLAELLCRAPQARGILYDRPEVLAGNSGCFRARGVADRVEFCGGDFLTDPIPRGDLYVLKRTLHDFHDHEAVRLLQRIRDAMVDQADRLLLCELIVTSDSRWDPVKFLDLDMLLLHGGRERTVAQWADLASAAGFVLADVPDVLILIPV
jgi:hypothetical protein